MTQTVQCTDHYLWEEAYRPQKLDDCIVPDQVKEALRSAVSEGQIPNLLLASPSPGTGKTSVAKALCNELGIRPLFINASMDNSIEDIRVKVLQYATTVSLTGDSIKVVILDECLEENQEVVVGTLDDRNLVKLKDMEMGKTYPVVSFNMDTGEFENDTAELISEKEEEVFEVTLEDGSVVLMTANHPAIILEDGKYLSRNIAFGLKVGDEVVTG